MIFGVNWQAHRLVRLRSRLGSLCWVHHPKPAKRCSLFQAESFRLSPAVDGKPQCFAVRRGDTEMFGLIRHFICRILLCLLEINSQIFRGNRSKSLRLTLSNQTSLSANTLKIPSKPFRFFALEMFVTANLTQLIWFTLQKPNSKKDLQHLISVSATFSSHGQVQKLAKPASCLHLLAI